LDRVRDVARTGDRGRVLRNGRYSASNLTTGRAVTILYQP
jgi:hypothetical protein